MLSDFEIIDLYFGGGLPSDQAFSAWQRIKDKLTAEALKPSHNKQSTPCTCINSCVATIYVCKDCGGRVNPKR